MFDELSAQITQQSFLNVANFPGLRQFSSQYEVESAFCEQSRDFRDGDNIAILERCNVAAAEVKKTNGFLNFSR